MLKENEFTGITKRSLRLCHATNLIFPNENMALRDGLRDAASKQLFCDALHQLLFGGDELQARFTQFFRVLDELKSAKWTTATYFPFIMFPDQCNIFLKPSNTRDAAGLSHYEINYRPQLNWLTYKCVLEFATYLRRQLSELRPRDMIDVQSFMWCIAPHD